MQGPKKLVETSLQRVTDRNTIIQLGPQEQFRKLQQKKNEAMLQKIRILRGQISQDVK